MRAQTKREQTPASRHGTGVCSSLWMYTDCRTYNSTHVHVRARALHGGGRYSRASSCGMHVAAMTGTDTPPPVRGTQHSSLTKAPVSSAACVRPAAT